LTTAQAARALGTSLSTLYRLLCDGRLPYPAWRVGTSYLWTSADMERLRAAYALIPSAGRPRKRKELPCAS
jgi:excisionase family DNA binding protein